MSSQVSIITLKKCLTELVPADIFTAVCNNPDTFEPQPEDRKYLSSVRNEKRGREFKLGRISARAALAELSAEYSKAGLQRLSSGAIAWPDGICGSVSHSAEIAMAAICRGQDFCSVGLDFEISREFNPDLIKKIARQPEFELACRFTADVAQAFFLIFCSKEAVFKCLHPLGYERLSFFDAELTAVNREYNQNMRLIYDFLSLSARRPVRHRFMISAYQGENFTLSLCAAKNRTE